MSAIDRHLEELVHKPLKWTVCLLHTNKLPLRHIFATLDGSTSGPNTFTSPIGKRLHGSVSTWSVDQFEQIPMPTSLFPKPKTHGNYAYWICWTIINGAIEDDLLYLEVGQTVQSRWLTLECRILRYYVSLDEPFSTQKILFHFCLTVYFPTWFDIK